MNDLISVIVPVFNTELYVKRCVNSIIKQTYENIQIIIVNDGSTDNSGEICRSLSKGDKRIQLIEKPNGGLSDARNAGIAEAEGEFLAFVDSDDYIHPEMIEIMHKTIIENDADISVCNFLYVDDLGNEIKKMNEQMPIKNRIMDTNHVLNEMFNPKGYYYVVAWNKLYRKKLFNHIRYAVGKIHEDEFIIHHLLGESNSIACTSSALYYYVQRDESIMKTPSFQSRLNNVEAVLDRARFCEKNGYRDYIGNLYVMLCDRMSALYSFSSKSKGQKRTMKKVRKLILKNHRYLKYCTSKQKCICIFIYCFPNSYLRYQTKKGK